MRDFKRIGDSKILPANTWLSNKPSIKDIESERYQTQPNVDDADSSIRQLWICVILQAMIDARQTHANGYYNTKNRKEARQVFDDYKNPKGDLQELADLANVPVLAIMKAYNDPKFNPEAVLRSYSNACSGVMRSKLGARQPNRLTML